LRGSQKEDEVYHWVVVSISSLKYDKVDHILAILTVEDRLIGGVDEDLLDLFDRKFLRFSERPFDPAVGDAWYHLVNGHPWG